MVNKKGNKMTERGPGQPRKTDTVHPITVRQHPKWLKMFREWSNGQPDSQAKQAKEGIELLMEKRNRMS